MKIYTTYFAMLRKLPNDIIPISIALKQPPNVSLPVVKALMPTWDILSEYKKNHDQDRYTERFKSEVLSKINVSKMMYAIEKNAKGKDIAFVCYEKRGDFCHRHIVADFLNQYGYNVQEWNPEK